MKENYYVKQFEIKNVFMTPSNKMRFFTEFLPNKKHMIMIHDSYCFFFENFDFPHLLR